MMKKPKPTQPGSAPADTEHDVDKALAAGSEGKAHKVVKPKPVAPPSRVRGDPERPAEAAVNAKREMPYDEAMKAHDAAKELIRLQELDNPTDAQRARMEALEPIAMKKSILTERGWVAMPNRRTKG